MEFFFKKIYLEMDFWSDDVHDPLSLLTCGSIFCERYDSNEASDPIDNCEADDVNLSSHMFAARNEFSSCPNCSDGGAVYPLGGGSRKNGKGEIGSKYGFGCSMCQYQWQENSKMERERLNGERGISPIKRARHGEKKRGHALEKMGGYMCSKCGQPKKGHICSGSIAQTSNDPLLISMQGAGILSLPPLVPVARTTQDISYKKVIADLKCFSPQSYYVFKLFNDVLNRSDLLSSKENNTYIFKNGNFELEKNKAAAADSTVKCESSSIIDILFKIVENENFTLVVSPLYNLSFPAASSPHSEFTAFFNGRIPGIAKLHKTMEDAIKHTLTNKSIIGICEAPNSMWASCYGHIVVDIASHFKSSFVINRHTPIIKDNGERVRDCFCLDRIYTDEYRSCEICHIVVDTTRKGKHNDKGFFCNRCNRKLKKDESLVPDMIECTDCAKDVRRLCHISCAVDHKKVSKETLLSDSSPYKCPLHY